MRKSLKSHEVYHFWANQTQSEGYSGNVSFRARDFISYRTTVARLMGKNDSVAVLSSITYSPTTAGHLSAVRSAASHKTIIEVPYPCGSVAQNFHAVESALKGYLESASTARTRQAFWVSKAITEAQAVNTFATLLGQEQPFDMAQFDNLDLKEIATKVRTENAVQLARRKAKAIEDKKNLTDKLNEWLAGIKDYPPHSNDVYLRLKGDVIQTTKRAEIPVRHAKRLWPLVQAVVRSGVTRECSVKLGVYGLNRIHADGAISVGCHFIKFPQLQRMAVLLGLPVEVVS